MFKNRVTVAGELLVIVFASSIYANKTETDTVNLCDSREVDYENYTTSRTELCDCDKESLCVRKCCRSGFFHYSGEDVHTGFYTNVCIKNNSTNFSVPIYSDVTKQYDLKDGFMVGMLRCNNNERDQYFKISNADSRQKFFIQNDGTLYYPSDEKLYSSDKYCVDDKDGLAAYVCLKPSGSFYYVAKIIRASANLASLPFLLTTFLIFLVVTESNLRDTCSMFYAVALIFGYSSLALAQYYGTESYYLCQALGFSIIYFMMASFLWMNAFCVVTWCTFSSLERCYRLKTMKEELLLIFSLYAWGIPGLLVAILFLLNTFGDITARFYPGIGSPLCFLNGHLPTLMYYFGPILIIIVINIVLCSLTAINIVKVQKELSMLKGSGSRRSKGREKRRIYWKLFFAVSINPLININVIQTISWVAGWKLSEGTATHISFVKDTAYATYGFFIFIIFGTRKKHWRMLKERCLPQKLSPADSRPLTTTYMATAENICR